MKFKFCVMFDSKLAKKRAGKTMEQAEILRKEYQKEYKSSQRFGYENRKLAEEFADSVDRKFFGGLMISEYDTL